MSGRVGLREDTRIGQQLAQCIAQWLVEARSKPVPISASKLLETPIAGMASSYDAAWFTDFRAG